MANSVTHEFKKGETMCWVSSINQENNKEVKNKYFQGVFPITGKIGIEFMGNLYVEKQIAGDHPAPAFSLVRFPSVKAKIDLNTTYLAEWGHIRKLRPDVWKNIIQRDYEVKSDISITLDDQKYYQVETFWVQQDREYDFEQNRKAVEKVILESKGRILYKDGAPAFYETLGKEKSPTNIVITEWDNKAQFEKHSKLDAAQPFKYLGGYNAWLMKPRIQS